jgi:hypothetical protein
MHVLVNELLVARIVQWMLRPAAVALWLGTLIVPLHTQPAPPPPSPVQIKDLQIPKLATPPRIEQFLGGASRADLRRIDDFRQRQPGDGVPVSRKTSTWIGYDDRNFYAVFVCDAPPGQTRARLAKREDIFSDDLVGVFFDTYPINYTPAAGLAPFLANGSELQATLTLRPVARLKIDQIYYLTRMHTAGTSVFVNHLARTRANYQFTRALSLRMIVDYNAVLENASLIDLTRQKRITGAALVTS